MAKQCTIRDGVIYSALSRALAPEEYDKLVEEIKEQIRGKDIQETEASEGETSI